MLKRVIALSSLLLVGCATPGGQDPLQALRKFTQTDLTSALEDAKAHNDMTAVDCWTALLQVSQIAPVQVPEIKGIASALQAKRNLVNGGNPAIKAMAQEINRGCAALFVDEQATLGSLGLLR